MKKIKHYFDDWSFLEKVWLIFVCSIIIIVALLDGDPIFVLIISFTGSVGIVLGAKGKILGLVFSLINALLYAIYCYDLKLYGEVMYNAFYSIPTSAIGIYLWTKHKNQSGEVQFQYMSPRMIIITFILVFITTFLYAELLKILGGRLAFIDSLTTVVSVIASLLFILRFADQWLMWILVNALSIWMWLLIYSSGEGSSIVIILMKMINLCNATYGYLNWRKIAKHTSNVR
ncbi:MAG: nicotinamide riboside transporter PnuC [Brevinema sp.]